MPPSTNNRGRRQDILQALATMLESSPGTRITTAALAAQVGFSEAALYRHFPSKTRMFEGLLDFTEDAVFSRIRAILDEEASTGQQCYRILLLLLTFAEKNPGICRVLSGEAIAGEDERLHTRVSGLFDRVETQLKQLLREGEIKEGLQTRLTTSASAQLMLVSAEGKIRQFVRSGFSRAPTADWADQWQALALGIFR